MIEMLKRNFRFIIIWAKRLERVRQKFHFSKDRALPHLQKLAALIEERENRLAMFQEGRLVLLWLKGRGVTL